MSLNASSNLQPSLYDCFKSRLNISISTALLFIYCILLLPLFIFILYLGCQRWRKCRSVAMTVTMSHSDIFTFHMVAMEMISILGSFFYCYGAYTDQKNVTEAGTDIFSIISPGQTLFHLLTCVDRYLAVVHPVTYLGLRQAGGVRIRNISIGCVWLISFGSASLSCFNDHFDIIHAFVLLLFSSVVVTFCCFSVLCVLIRPGPGEMGGNRDWVDQSKQRAFYTIMAINGVLLLRFLSDLVSTALYATSTLHNIDMCVLEASEVWFSLPSSLVLPLLFLHRAGKLPDCKHWVNKLG